MKLLFIISGLLIISTSFSQQVPDNTGSSISVKEAQAALDFHNKIRKNVGEPPLEWSASLSACAQEWAENLAKSCKMEHRPVGGKWARKYGENLFWGSGREFTALEASQAWYSEVKKYHYAAIDQSNWEPTGHYTQMVWKGTTKIGMALVHCNDGAIIIVANYDPPGNYLGQKPY